MGQDPSGRELFYASLGLVTAALVIGGIALAIYRARTRKLRVLEQALQNGALSQEAQELLVAELTKAGPLGRLWAGGRLMVALGWLGMFVGISIMIVGGRGSEEVGLPMALLSFGVLTLPFALREMDHKRPAASRRP